MRDGPLSIGDRIRKRRRELGLPQRDLSQPGISDAYISRIESGQRRPPLKTLRKLAPKLETTAHRLETGAPHPAYELAALVVEYGRRPRFLVERRNWHAKRSEKARARVVRKSRRRNIFCPRRRPPGCRFGLGVCSAGRCGACFGRQRLDRRVEALGNFALFQVGVRSALVWVRSLVFEDRAADQDHARLRVALL
jgi:transcriptional regulator with XRE-family HTH domain